MELVKRLVDATAQVLEEVGLAGTSTNKIAARAGVAIGSIYQYFPNKEAILFRLQADEWQQTGGLLQTMLADRTLPPTERLRAIVRAFFRSEVEEAALDLRL